MIIHILPNISRSKGSQAIEFGQFIEYNKRDIFSQTWCEKLGSETTSRLRIIRSKSKWPPVWFQYISIALNLAYSENKYYKTLHYWLKDILNFAFSEKGLGIGFPSDLVYDFSRKMFLILFSINWPNFLVRVSFISWDIGQYMYCNCLFPRLWRHKFWN